MRRTILPFVLLGAVACQPGAAPLTDADVTAIRSLGTSYAQAVLANDGDAIAALYAEDAIEMPPNMVTRSGKEAIRAAYVSEAGSGVMASEFALTAIDVDGSGDLAYDRGAYSWTGTPPGMTEPMTETGKYLCIVRRQEDGSWLWSTVIWNSDNPPPPAEGEHSEGEDHS